MQAQSDKQGIDILEKKMDEGFARLERTLSEMREDTRELRGQVSGWGRSIVAMWLTMILGFAGIVIAILAHV